MAVEFRLLGGVEAAADSQPVAIGFAQVRCTLAVLLLDANRTVSVDHLVDRVWGNRSLPQRPRSAVQHAIALLRGALSGVRDVTITRRSVGYRLVVDPQAVDVHRFRELLSRARAAGDDDHAAALFGQAFELWRGEPFLGLDTPWLESVRATLSDECDAARLDFLDVQLRRGQHAVLLAELAARSSDCPLDERVAGQLMLALFRCGRPGDALREYRRVRARLADELGADPGSALRLLHQRILTDDPSLAPAPRPSAPATCAPVTVPRQVPAAPRWFSGRREELDVLLARAAGPAAGSGEARGGDGPSVVVIDGMAGVGKTGLAVQAAHRLAGAFPDGQLFIDLHGHTEGFAPRTSGEALDWLLHALGVPPERIPPDVEARAALYRQRLFGSRTLIVLDNAADEAQVRPLLPADAGCLVVVTSRRRLKGLDEACPVSLGVLPPSDAVALLRAVIGESRAEVPDDVLAEIAQLCGRLPLALRIAAALAAHRPTWPLQCLVGLLRDQRPRLGVLTDGERDLSAEFDLSYRTLPRAHRRLFRRLGLMPGPDIDAYAAAALTDAHPTVVARLLEDLADHNLLILHAAGRYLMHDLIRLHARDLAGHDSAGDRDAALARLLDYYRHTADRAHELIRRIPRPKTTGQTLAHTPAHAPALPGPDAAWAWLRAERSGLHAALEYAAANGMPERAIALTVALSTMLHVDGPLTQAVGLYTAAIQAAGRQGDRPHQAHLLTLIAEARIAAGDFAAARDDLRCALTVFGDLGDRTGQANALTILGRLRAIAGDHEAALSDLADALDRFRAMDEPRGEANALAALGLAHGLAGDVPGALRSLRQAMVLFQDLGDRHGRANAFMHVSILRWQTGCRPGTGEGLARAAGRAVDDLSEALSLFEELEDRRGQATAHVYLAEIRGLTGEHEAAIRDLHRALELSRHLGDTLKQAVGLATLGRIRGLAGDHDAAIRDLRRALALLGRTGGRGYTAWALNCYATEIAATGHPARALALHRHALGLAGRARRHEYEAAAHEGIGTCHALLGDTHTAATHLTRALGLYRHLTLTPDTHRVRERLNHLTGGPVIDVD